MTERNEGSGEAKTRLFLYCDIVITKWQISLFFFQAGSIRTALRMSMTDAFYAIRELMFLLRKHRAGEYWIVKCVLQVILLSLKEEFFCF